MRYTIKTKITASIISIVTLSFLSFATINYLSEASRIDKALQDKLEQLTVVAGRGFDDPIWNYSDSAIKEFSEALLSDKEIAVLEIQDKTGRNLFTKAKEGDQYQASQLIYTVKEINHEGKKIGNIKIGMTRYFSIQILNSILFVSTITLLLVIGLLFAIISLITHVITKPLKVLCMGIGKIAEGDLTTKIARTSNDELGDLAEQINSMTANLFVMVNKIQETAETLSASSEELASTVSSNLQI